MNADVYCCTVVQQYTSAFMCWVKTSQNTLAFTFTTDEMWHRLRKVRSISRESTKPDGTIIVKVKQRKKIINAFLLKLIVYLAVEICHRWTSLSATPSFQAGKNFDNRQKHQRRRSAWVGQANFGKLELQGHPTRI